METPPIPEDGAPSPWASLLARLDDRTAPGWSGITCYESWYPVVELTDKVLAAIDPAYVIHQIKDKFGGLRYYYDTDHSWGSPERDAMEAVIGLAERAVAALEIERLRDGERQ